MMRVTCLLVAIQCTASYHLPSRFAVRSARSSPPISAIDGDVIRAVAIYDSVEKGCEAIVNELALTRSRIATRQGGAQLPAAHSSSAGEAAAQQHQQGQRLQLPSLPAEVGSKAPALM